MKARHVFLSLSVLALLSACKVPALRLSSSDGSPSSSDGVSEDSDSLADTSSGEKTSEEPPLSSSVEDPSSSDETPAPSSEEPTPSSSEEMPSSSDETPASSSVAGRTLLWSDEFNGSSIDTDKWDFDTGIGPNSDGWGNWEKQYYRKENASVSNGSLIITAKKEEYGGYSYTSAKLKTYGKYSFTYGYVEARMKLPAISGTWPAFWMLPVSAYNSKGWPFSGEIDIMENRGHEPNLVSSTLHSGVADGEWYSHYVTKETTLSESVSSWHTYAVDWRNGSISFYVDDVKTVTYQTSDWSIYSGYSGDAGAPFNKDFYIMLNLAIGGQFIEHKLPEDADLPTQMEVDYVRVYA